MDTKTALALPGDEILCATAVIIKDDTILTGLRHYDTDKWKKIDAWTLPGGRTDIGETVEETLRREVVEEVAIDELKVQELIADLPGAKEGDRLLVFVCTTQQDFTLMEPEKFSQWRWITFTECLADDKYFAMNPEARKVICEYVRKR